MRHAHFWPIALTVVTAACSDQKQQAAPPPPIVEILTIKAETVPNVVELPGRIEAVRTAEVRARTDGIVERRLYAEGTDVKAGTPLFQIDARDYRAQAQQAQASLAQAISARDNAAAVMQRYTPLVRERAVSGQEFDAARADYRQAEAKVMDAQAALTRARLTLSFTTVRAPIAGRVGRAAVTEGALVSGGEATLLTQIDQPSPIYAVFTESNATMLDLMNQVRNGKLRISRTNLTVQLILENGETYGPVGQMDFADATVDPQTGSQRLRAHFDNPQMILKPGQFVRGRISAGTFSDGMVVPARAVQLKDDQASVAILGRDGTVTQRPVKLGQMMGDRWVVQSGIKVGERLIVEGWQKVRPGQKAMLRAEAEAAARKAGAAGATQGGR